MTKQSVKGKKGFQSVHKEVKMDKRGVFYLTEEQMKVLRAYCKGINTTPSELIRERLEDIIGI
jgi:hypothetical protein